MQEIKIKQIEILENIRTDVGDLSELMASIKQHGLLEPIGIWQEKEHYILAYGFRRLEALKKLGWEKLEVGKEVLILPERLNLEQFLSINTSENLHRKEIAPFELGKICNRLRSIGYSVSEIAEKLSVAKPRVVLSLEIFSRIPDRFKNQIGFMAGRSKEAGKIPVTQVIEIIKGRIPKEKTEELLEQTRKQDLTINEIRLAIRIIAEGMSVKSALNNLNHYITITPKFVVNKDKLEYLMKKYQITKSRLLNKMLIGEIDIVKGFILTAKDFD